MPNYGWRRQSKCIFDSDWRFEFHRNRDIQVRDTKVDCTIELDLGQPSSMAAGCLRSNMFSTQYIIPLKYQADFQDSGQQIRSKIDSFQNANFLIS